MRVGLGRFVLLPAVRFERKDDVQEHEEREHERLNEADEELEADERQDQTGNEQQSGEDSENDLAALDVPPESQGEREYPKELTEELDDANEDHHAAD